MTDEEALILIHALVDEGWLIGVELFGEDEDTGVGLCDVFSKNSPSGSDCNRAERWLMRPHDNLMTEALRLKIIEE